MFANFSLDDFKTSLHDTGKILAHLSILFLVPLILAVIFNDGLEAVTGFGTAFAANLFAGFVLTRFKSRKKTELRHAMLTVIIIWILFPLFAALPFKLISNIGLLDSFFESVSALTTTGLSIVSGELAVMPYSLLFWRNFLGWAGGIGIVVIASLGLMEGHAKLSKLFKAEGREVVEGLNIKSTMRELIKIYSALTVVGIVLLMISGMSLWQATNYSMSSISTTGFSMQENELSADNYQWSTEGIRNYWIDLSLIIIMFFGTISFAVYHKMFKEKNFKSIFRNMEFKVLVLMSAVLTIPVAVKLGIESSLFHVISAITTGGTQIASFAVVSAWPDDVKLLMIIGMIIGGSTLSTAGGIKLRRFAILMNTVYWKTMDQIMPKNRHYPKKIEGEEISREVIYRTMLFISLYVLFLVAGTIVLASYGVELGNAMFDVASAQGNVGISTGSVNPSLPALAKIMLAINMIVGRLEIIPFLSLTALILSKARTKLLID